MRIRCCQSIPSLKGEELGTAYALIEKQKIYELTLFKFAWHDELSLQSAK
jgi:hypothetical protein